MDLACFDPSSTFSTKKQQFSAGQTLNFPLPPGISVYIECQNGYIYDDGFKIKNVSCTSYGWPALPSACIGMSSWFKNLHFVLKDDL